MQLLQISTHLRKILPGQIGLVRLPFIANSPATKHPEPLALERAFFDALLWLIQKPSKCPRPVKRTKMGVEQYPMYRILVLMQQPSLSPTLSPFAVCLSPVSMPLILVFCTSVAATRVTKQSQWLPSQLICLTGGMPNQWHLDTVSFASIGTATRKSKLNREKPD